MDEAAAGSQALIPLLSLDDAPDQEERVQSTLIAMEASRQKIERSLTALRDEADRYTTHARSQLDWRAWAMSHPWKVVGVSFAVGLYFGLRD
jgi:ElaB/YqjD/DUF883 family membrane-anchored ribosome-binding protein